MCTTARPQLAKAGTPFQGEARFPDVPLGWGHPLAENVLYGLPWGKLWGFK